MSEEKHNLPLELEKIVKLIDDSPLSDSRKVKLKQWFLSLALMGVAEKEQLDTYIEAFSKNVETIQTLSDAIEETDDILTKKQGSREYIELKKEIINNLKLFT